MCDCIERMNEKLEPLNTRLDIPIVVSGGQIKSYYVAIATKKLDSSNRQKPIRLFASYCPFCGEKYDDVP